MTVQRVQTKAPTEATIGYCRAVRVGNQVLVAGTAPVPQDGGLVPVGADAQTRLCFEIIESALKQVGAGLSDVVRTRVFLTDMADWPEVGRAHGAIFADIRPACTMVQVAGLMDHAWKVEIEADAIVGAGERPGT